MKLVNKILVISTVLAILFSLNGTSAHAQAGAKCVKAGQTRTIKGVSYICTAKANVKKGAKATAVWVASAIPVTTTSTTSTTIPETDKYVVSYFCGETFVNSRYPELELDKLLVKPSSQSVFISGKTSGCSVSVTWTPSQDSSINLRRNLSLCMKDIYGSKITIQCSGANYPSIDGRAIYNFTTSTPQGLPYFGYRLAQIKGYIGDSATAVWASAEHLVVYDFDCQGSCSYAMLQGIPKLNS